MGLVQVEVIAHRVNAADLGTDMLWPVLLGNLVVNKPFAQADGTLARQYDGIGMGLAYVHEMVHHLGGTLDVESTPGGGSRFTVTLPA